MIFLALSENIRTVRELKNVSQTELAERVNVNQSYISQVETGVRSVSVAVLESIADVLDCSVDRLLGRDEKYINSKEN